MFCVLSLEYIFYVNFIHNVDAKLRGKEKYKYGLRLIIACPPHNKGYVCRQGEHLHTHICTLSVFLSVSFHNDNTCPSYSKAHRTRLSWRMLLPCPTLPTPPQ